MSKARCDRCPERGDFRVKVYLSERSMTPTLTLWACRTHALQTKDWYVDNGLVVDIKKENRP